MTVTQTQAAATATGPARTSVLVVLENELARCGVTTLLRTVPRSGTSGRAAVPSRPANCSPSTGPTSWSATAAADRHRH
jgi:hypothetical protein